MKPNICKVKQKFHNSEKQRQMIQSRLDQAKHKTKKKKERERDIYFMFIYV